MNAKELKLYELLEVAGRCLDQAELTKYYGDFVAARIKLNEAKELIKEGLKDE